MTSRTRLASPELALVGGSLPWLVVLGWLASAAWFLCDDAFISFRYARNLVTDTSAFREACRGAPS